jgi:hypothetical protein
MSNYKSNIVNFDNTTSRATLNYYTPSLGIPDNAAVHNYPVSSNYQVVPVFRDVSYTAPNYDSLTNPDKSFRAYPSIKNGYMDTKCVEFIKQSVGVAK